MVNDNKMQNAILTILFGCMLKNILVSAFVAQHFNDGLQNNLQV
jgi:hypothetical protein